jgi:type IV pilus assembly protein PilW
MRRYIAVRCSPGFSLIELMIAMTIGLALLLGIATLTSSHSRSARELDMASRQIETGRFAIQYIGNDLSLAGFYGNFVPRTAAISTPDPCATAVASFGFDNTTSPVTLPAPVYGYAPGATAPTCLSNVKGNTGILVVRRVSSISVTPAATAAGETYVQSARCTTDPRSFIVDTITANLTLHEKDCSTLASVRKYMVRTYYVSSCNVCTGPNADTKPTLKVAELGGGAITITPLAEGIRDFEADYGVDLDNDGSTNCYVLDPGVDNSAKCGSVWTTAPGYAAGIQNWGNVVAVRLHVLAENAASSSDWTDDRVYDMGLAGTVGPVGDRVKRHAYSSVIRISNVAGLKDL